MQMLQSTSICEQEEAQPTGGPSETESNLAINHPSFFAGIKFSERCEQPLRSFHPDSESLSASFASSSSSYHRRVHCLPVRGKDSSRQRVAVFRRIGPGFWVGFVEARTNEEVYQVRFLLGQGLLAMIKCSIHQLGHDLLAMIKRSTHQPGHDLLASEALFESRKGAARSRRLWAQAVFEGCKTTSFGSCGSTSCWPPWLEQLAALAWTRQRRHPRWRAPRRTRWRWRSRTSRRARARWWWRRESSYPTDLLPPTDLNGERKVVRRRTERDMEPQGRWKSTPSGARRSRVKPRYVPCGLQGFRRHLHRRRDLRHLVEKRWGWTFKKSSVSEFDAQEGVGGLEEEGCRLPSERSQSSQGMNDEGNLGDYMIQFNGILEYVMIPDVVLHLYRNLGWEHFKLDTKEGRGRAMKGRKW